MADELFADEIALSPPPEWSIHLKNKLERHYNALNRVSSTTYELGAELPDDLRAEFVSRETVIRPALEARNCIAVAHAVKGMLDTFMAKPISDKSIKLIAYTRALEKFPPWAARNACWRFVTGEEPRRTKEWAPGPDVLTQAAVNVMLPFSVELLKLTRVLRANSYVRLDPAARAQVLAKMKDLRAHLALRSAELNAMPKRRPPRVAGEFEEF